MQNKEEIKKFIEEKKKAYVVFVKKHEDRIKQWVNFHGPDVRLPIYYHHASEEWLWMSRDQRRKKKNKK